MFSKEACPREPETRDLHLLVSSSVYQACALLLILGLLLLVGRGLSPEGHLWHHQKEKPPPKSTSFLLPSDCRSGRREAEISSLIAKFPNPNGGGGGTVPQHYLAQTTRIK